MSEDDKYFGCARILLKIYTFSIFHLDFPKNRHQKKKKLLFHLVKNVTNRERLVRKALSTTDRLTSAKCNAKPRARNSIHIFFRRREMFGRACALHRCRKNPRATLRALARSTTTEYPSTDGDVHARAIAGQQEAAFRQRARVMTTSEKTAAGFVLRSYAGLFTRRLARARTAR